ncbi:MAG TPA: hypothetical protein EYO33_28950 [Phycisphaerales bacterium]|nr:hypothetical protein [Phycisphaerales bacterium]
MPGLITCGGIGLFVYGMLMDVTVATGTDLFPRVANIHLMAQQRNFQMSGAFFTFLGLLYAFYVSKNPPVRKERYPTGISSRHPAEQIPQAPSEAQQRLSELRGTEWWDEMSKEKKQGVVLALVAIIAVCLIVVLGSLSSGSPAKSAGTKAATAPVAVQQPETLKKVDLAIEQLDEKVESEPEKPESPSRNQCFHRDIHGNRDCTEAQVRGLYCARHDKKLLKAVEPPPEPEPEEAPSYDFNNEPAATVYKEPVAASVGREPSYPTKDPDSIYVAHKPGACYWTDSRGNYTCRRPHAKYSVYCTKHRGY